MTKPRVILGTMTLGGQTSEESSRKMLLDFCSPKYAAVVRSDPMLDSAIMYQNGSTEKILGRILGEESSSFPANLSVSSKANPFTKDKKLSPTGVRSQIEESLRSLRRDHVDLYYLHAPDVNHPIEPTLEEIQKLYLESKMKSFGLSNFAAWEVVYIHSYMSRRGYVVPIVYQGMYNAITRSVEAELFPALRKLGMAFYAYNPLAAGMLSGKYEPPPETLKGDKDADDAAAKRNAEVGTRFAGKTYWARRYRERFQQREQFEAVDIIREALGDDGGMADASLRWLYHHSHLRHEDGIIVGASTPSHFEANMESLSAGLPLPEKVLQAFNDAYQLCENVCPDYARGYSGANC